MYIYFYNFKTRLNKHEFEFKLGTTREKQKIEIKCSEIWKNNFSNVTRNCLSNMHIKLETYKKARR